MRKAGLFFFAIVVFQLISIALYYFGPITYNVPEHSIEVGLWIIYYIGMLISGYFLARKIGSKQNNKHRQRNYVVYGSVLTLIFSIIYLYLKIGNIDLNENIGNRYSNALDHHSDNFRYIEYARFICAIYLFGLIPIYIYKFKNISLYWKLFGALAIILKLLIGYISGINKPFADFIFLTIMVIFIFKPINIRRTIVGGFLVVIFFVAFGFYFTQSQLQRYGSAAVSGVDSVIGFKSEYNINDGGIAVFYSSFSSYLTQGVRALDLARTIPFESTLGGGNSTFISRQVDGLFGSSITDKTYPAKLEDTDNWDRYIYWSSFYLWVASDVSYYGVGLIMFFVGFWYRIVLNSAVKFGDNDSIVLLSYMSTGLIYLFANNQLLQSGETAIGFLYAFVWFVFGRKLVWLSPQNIK